MLVQIDEKTLCLAFTQHKTHYLILWVLAHVYIRGKNYAQVTGPRIYLFWMKILVLWPWEPKQCAIFSAQVFFQNKAIIW